MKTKMREDVKPDIFGGSDMTNISRSTSTARMIGSLFLIAMAASIAGGLIVESSGTEGTNLLVTGVLLEVVNALCVAGIGVLMYPVLKDRSERAAAGYLGFRLLEAFACMLITAAPLALMYLSAGPLPPVLSTPENLEAVSLVLNAGRAAVSNLFIPVFLALGGFVLYGYIIKTGLLPAFIGIWGVIAAALMLILNILLTYNIQLPVFVSAVLVVPLITNEVFLGLRLLFKGFSYGRRR